MPINSSKATFFRECEICQEKFWDEDTVAYLTTAEVKGELVTVCRGCLPKVDTEEEKTQQ